MTLSVEKDFFLNKLIKAEIPEKLFHIIYSMYKGTNCRIKFPNGMSEDFPTTCGVKQGDVLGPLLFNIFMKGKHSQNQNYV